MTPQEKSQLLKMELKAQIDAYQDLTVEELINVPLNLFALDSQVPNLLERSILIESLCKAVLLLNPELRPVKEESDEE